MVLSLLFPGSGHKQKRKRCISTASRKFHMSLGSLSTVGCAYICSIMLDDGNRT